MEDDEPAGIDVGSVDRIFQATGCLCRHKRSTRTKSLLPSYGGLHRGLYEPQTGSPRYPRVISEDTVRVLGTVRVYRWRVKLLAV